MTDPVSSSRRLDGIDVLRAVAALSVFLFHLNIGLPSNLPGPLGVWRNLWRHGHLGVPMFFVISGLCIGYSWLKSESAMDFSWARFRRIMPPYWASLGLILIVAVVTKLATGTNDVAVLPRSVAGITATGLLLTEPLSRIPAMSGVYWSLSCEIVFYALMALLLFLPRLQRIPAAAILHVILCLAGLFNPPLDGWFRPLTLWPLFGTGLALALLPRAPRWAATMILFSVAQAFAHIAHHQLIEYSLTAAATAVCLVIVLRWPGIVWPRWLVWIGGISYSVYIVHATIAGPVFGRILHRQMALPLVELLRQGFVVVGTLVICGIFHLCFERPWMHRRPNFPLT